MMFALLQSVSVVLCAFCLVAEFIWWTAFYMQEDY